MIDPSQKVNVAMLLSCGSFEGFFGWIQGQTRQSYLETYRNDWAWYYAQGLRENGVNPTLYIPALRERGKHQTDVGVSVRFLPLEWWYRPFENVWAKRLSRRSRWSLYADELFNSMAFKEPLREALAEDEIDLLYIQEYWSGRFDYFVRRLDLPVVGADHGGVSDRVVKLFKPESFKKAAFCCSQTADECRIVERYGGRSVLAPNGCDLSVFFPDPAAPRSKTVLTVARLTNRQKRTSDLICALAKLPEDWSLDIVGAGPDRSMLEAEASDRGVSSRVRFRGFLGRAEVRALLRRCGVYAMPSSNEAVALSALEAMACGASVVFSRIRTFEDLVDDGMNGRLVAVGDVDGLAAALLDAWENRESFGRAAHETIRARYDSRVLYAQLAASLRGAVRASHVLA